MWNKNLSVNHTFLSYTIMFIIDNKGKIKYIELSKKNVPRFPIFGKGSAECEDI